MYCSRIYVLKQTVFLSTPLKSNYQNIWKLLTSSDFFPIKPTNKTGQIWPMIMKHLNTEKCNHLDFQLILYARTT